MTINSITVDQMYQWPIYTCIWRLLAQLYLPWLDTFGTQSKYAKMPPFSVTATIPPLAVAAIYPRNADSHSAQ